MAKEPDQPPPADRIGLGALAALVVGLGIVVWLALPNDADLKAAGDAGPWSGLGAEGGSANASGGEAAKPGALERLAEASAELAILTDKPEVEVAKLGSAEAVAKLLDVRHCGATCDALRKVVTDHDHFEIEVIKTEDYILPPKESWETIAPSLTPAERESIGQRAATVVIRTRGASTIDQLPARTAFAAAAAVSERLSGLVYDETVRRIETAPQFAQRVITAPLGQNVFTPRQISVQLFQQEDGTARLLTLGMVRFGSPDFTMRGASMELGPSLANVMNAVASSAAACRTELPVVVTRADVARASGQAAQDLAKDPGGPKAVLFDVVDFERAEGDPENEMLELVPRGGATREVWSAAVTDVFGETPKVVFATFDKELEGIAARARRELPAAVKRFEGGEGALFVKGPFAIPEASRVDGGAKDEWMWVEVSSCDAKGCSGALSNTPGFATNLSAGKPVTVTRDKTADWLLRTKDGGAAGGESIKALQKRAR